MTPVSDAIIAHHHNVCSSAAESEPIPIQAGFLARIFGALQDSRAALRELADASEAMVSSDPEMLSHESSEREFDAALERARRLLP